MRIFVGDSSVHIVEEPRWSRFPLQCMHSVVDSQEALRKKHLKGHVLCLSLRGFSFQSMVRAMGSLRAGSACHLVYVVEDKALVVRQIKEELFIVQAAGGVVRKGDSLLFIRRKGHWDLPKGRVEKGGKNPSRCRARGGGGV